jgi:hypothetical protein
LTVVLPSVVTNNKWLWMVKEFTGLVFIAIAATCNEKNIADVVSWLSLVWEWGYINVADLIDRPASDLSTSQLVIILFLSADNLECIQWRCHSLLFVLVIQSSFKS